MVGRAQRGSGRPAADAGRRKIVAQVATVLDTDGESVTMVAVRPDPDERDALIAAGHPYLSRGPWDDRLGQIAVRVDSTSDWQETAPKTLVAQLDATPDRRRRGP